jgi:hypothetical protein
MENPACDDWRQFQDTFLQGGAILCFGYAWVLTHKPVVFHCHKPCWVVPECRRRPCALTPVYTWCMCQWTTVEGKLVRSQTKELAFSHECVSLNVSRDAAVNVMIINGWYFSCHPLTFHVRCVASSTNLIVSTLELHRRVCCSCNALYVNNICYSSYC